MSQQADGLDPVVLSYPSKNDIPSLNHTSTEWSWDEKVYQRSPTMLKTPSHWFVKVFTFNVWMVASYAQWSTSPLLLIISKSHSCSNKQARSSSVRFVHVITITIMKRSLQRPLDHHGGETMLHFPTLLKCTQRTMFCHFLTHKQVKSYRPYFIKTTKVPELCNIS